MKVRETKVDIARSPEANKLIEGKGAVVLGRDDD